jgi:hypothetical protein
MVLSANNFCILGSRTSSRQSTGGTTPSLPKTRPPSRVSPATHGQPLPFMQIPDAGKAGQKRTSIDATRPTPGAGRPKPKPPTKPRPAAAPMVRAMYGK